MKFQNFDGVGFELDAAVRADLEAQLSGENFCRQVAANAKDAVPEGRSLAYSGQLFEPVPWSPTTPKGMPAAMEQFHNNPDFVIINVPPPFMFKAKVFKPSRLCAVYQIKD